MKLDRDLVDLVKLILLELYMQLSTTNQYDMLLLYCTVVQSLLTTLRGLGLSETQITYISQQFDFVPVVSAPIL